MDHPKFTAFIAALEALFHEADEALEEKWGTRFSLHPNRPRRGETGNRRRHPGHSENPDLAFD